MCIHSHTIIIRIGPYCYPPLDHVIDVEVLESIAPRIEQTTFLTKIATVSDVFRKSGIVHVFIVSSHMGIFCNRYLFQCLI